MCMCVCVFFRGKKKRGEKRERNREKKISRRTHKFLPSRVPSKEKESDM